MRISYKFRMYESSKRHRLDSLVTWSTRIWNHLVAFQKTYYRLFGKYCNKFQLMKHIAKVRNRRAEWQIVGSQSVQAVVEKLDKTYQAFFKWVKTRVGPKRGKPKFKRSAASGSVVFKQAGWAYRGGNQIRIGKYNYKFIKSRELDGDIKTVNLKRDSVGRLWITFSCEKQDIEFQNTGSINTAGFDFGLKTFLMQDNGDAIESPQFLKLSLAKLSQAGRKLSSKVKGSNNRSKAKRELARLHDKVACQRRDWFFKLAHSLCDKLDRMYFETLNLKAMQKLWGRKIGDLALDSFLQILQWVATKRGKQVGFIGRWEPTTTICFVCGSKQAMPLKERTFECGVCGHSDCRDANAAKNIKRLGHQADGLEDVRPSANLAVLV